MRKCPKCGRQFAENERVCPDDGSILEVSVSAEDRAVGLILHEKYRIDGFLKKGGMGAVYRGTHSLTPRSRAAPRSAHGVLSAHTGRSRGRRVHCRSAGCRCIFSSLLSKARQAF